MRESRRKRSDLLGALIAAGFILVFCALLLRHDPLVFWNDDYELSILPVFADVARSWGEGHWPLLSPFSWVCNNLAGEYQYGTFSLFVNAAVVLIWKFPLTFPEQAAALSIVHLVVLALGAFLLARRRDLDIPLSIFVSLVATLNGWIICWGATDWFGALAAFAWLPWCWWAIEKSLEKTFNSESFREQAAKYPTSNVELRASVLDARCSLSVGCFLRAVAWPAPFVYLLVTGGFPYTVVMLALLVAWLAIKAVWEAPQRPDSATFRRRIANLVPMLIGVALGFAMAAPAWLALLDYTAGSNRAATAAGAHWQWIVPWRALVGFIIPSWTTNWADFSSRLMPHTPTELACGLVAPSVVVAGFLWHPRRIVRHFRWEWFLLVVVLALCMMPSAGVFRWSFRWLPLLHLVLGLCAASVLSLRHRLPAASTAMLLLIIVSSATAIFETWGQYGGDVVLMYFVIATVWTVGEWFVRDRAVQLWSPAAVTFGVLLATYFCIPPNCGVPKYNLSQQLLDPAPLDPARLYLSVYPPPEHVYRVEAHPAPVGQIARPGSTSMWAGLRFINGYSPILAAGIARELHFAIHGELDPNYAEYILRDQSGALAELGVDGLVIANTIRIDPPPNEWQLAFSTDEGRVFHRPGAPFATVRSVEWIDSLPDKEFVLAQVSDIRDSRNFVSADVNVPDEGMPALLKFSRPFFRGYRATLDGHSIEVSSYRGLVPVVELPSGAHGRVVLSYRPGWLISGGIVAGIATLIWIIAALYSWQKAGSRNAHI